MLTFTLRADLIGAYQKLEANGEPGEHYAAVMGAMAPVPERVYPLRRLESEHMAEVGVAMRHDHPRLRSGRRADRRIRRLHRRPGALEL